MALTYVKSSGIDITGDYTVNNLSATANVTSEYFIGNGSLLTSIVGSTVTGEVANAAYATNSGSATNSVTVTGNAQPNITSLGTLSGLTVSGIISSFNSSEVRAAPTISSNTLTINLTSATLFDVALDSNITTLTLSNIQASGYSSSFVLIFTADGTSRTVVWPASFKWPSGTAPTITSTSGKKDVFVFFTIDGGTTWQAFISGQNL